MTLSDDKLMNTTQFRRFVLLIRKSKMCKTITLSNEENKMIDRQSDDEI